MNRRGFLRTLLTAAVVGPAAVKAIATAAPAVAIPGPAAAPPAALWVAEQWAAKEFDYGGSVGVCVTILNRLTGERRRHGVLINGRRQKEAEPLARAILEAWVKDVNDGAGVAFQASIGFRDDEGNAISPGRPVLEIQEGHEALVA